ncbi:nucleolar protein dao-5-like isoform X2 [Lineus longissimus]|uniref:nucleolar protein dao-5-like isoform X2 n=1 Tax=Lineus longissimus TaxID=88925 RepID=UPI00315D25CA
MPRKSRAASKPKEAEERVTRTSLRSRSRGGAAAPVMEPPKAKGSKSSPSPSSPTSGRSSRRKSASPSPGPKGRGARSRSSKAEEPEKASPAKGPAAKGKAVQEEKPEPAARGRRGRKAEEPEEMVEDVAEENEEEGKEKKEEEEKPSLARAAAKRGGRAAKSKKAVEQAEEEVAEEVAPEEEKKPAESPAKGRGRGRVARKSDEPAVAKSPATGRAARGRRSGAAEATESPKEEVKAEEGGRSSRRRSAAADKSPEKKPAPSPKRRGRGMAEKAVTGEAEGMVTELVPLVEKLPEQTKPSPKRRSRGKPEETKIEQKDSEPVAARSTRKAKSESKVEAAAGLALEKEAPKEQVIGDASPKKAAAKEPESVEMKMTPSPEVATTAAKPASSPTKKRKREADNEEIGSRPKKRKSSAKNESPVVVPLVEEEAMETDEPEGASVVDSSSALKQIAPPVLDVVAAKEAEAVPTRDEAPLPQRVQSNTNMTEPPTSSHGVISSFPAETEQLTPEAEAAEADYESLPTPPDQDMTGEEPDQSDECAPAVLAPMPETREAEHIHEAKEPTPVATAVPVAAPEPVQSSLEVNRNQMKPSAPRKEHEPDQSSAVRPVRQAMETDLSSGSAEACPVPVQVPEVVEPVIIPERAQMLYDSSAAPSSSSSAVRVEREVQGSEAMPAKASQGEEAMKVEQKLAVPPVSSSMEADSGANSTSGQQTDVASDYVVVSMADVPPTDSTEVKQSLPREHTPLETEPKSSSDGVLVSSTKPPLMNNHQDTHSNAVDAMNGHSASKDLLLNRKYIQNVAIDSNTLDPAKQFSVVSYNILAECHRKRGDYSHAAEEVLEQGYRHRRLMLELKYLDADVICLQEVDPDYYTNTLEPALKALGYSGEYKKRVDDFYHEGEATFYRSSQFSLVECSSVSFRDAVEKDLAVSTLTKDEKAAVKNYTKDPSIVLLTRLKCNTTGKEVTVGNIHVAYAYFKHPDLQCVQIAYAVNRLVAMAGGLQNAHILCGDFNCEATWAPFQLARDGYLANEMIEQLQAMECIELPDGQKKSLVNLFWKGFQHTSPNLLSAYSTVQDHEPTMTSIDPTWSGCIDFILLSQSLAPMGVLQTNCQEMIPNRMYPSDHLSLKSSLAWRKSQPSPP